MHNINRESKYEYAKIFNYRCLQKKIYISLTTSTQPHVLIIYFKKFFTEDLDKDRFQTGPWYKFDQTNQTQAQKIQYVLQFMDRGFETLPGVTKN